MECNEKLNIHQINKLDVNDLKRKDIFPITVTSAVFDKQGNSLEALLLQNNSIFLSYKGSSEATYYCSFKDEKKRTYYIL